MAGASLAVWVLDVRIWQMAAATTAAFCDWSFRRLTTAGTGGTAITPSAYDQSDATVGASAMTLPTAKGTEGAVPWRQASYFTQTPGAGAVAFAPLVDYVSGRSPLAKPIRIPNGTANGLAIRNDTAIAGATVSGYAIIGELSVF